VSHEGIPSIDVGIAMTSATEKGPVSTVSGLFFVAGDANAN
jgi:hypothetical protein